MTFDGMFAGIRPLFDAGAAAAGATWPTGTWWLSGGIGAANCLAAYQPKGAPDLATSYRNVANPGTYDATVATDLINPGGIPATAPAWAAATGWQFNGVDDVLDTYITSVELGHGTGSFLVRYSYAAAPSAGPLLGTMSPDNEIILRPVWNVISDYVSNGGWGPATDATAGLSGVLGVAGLHWFANGIIQDEDLEPWWGVLETVSLTIGATHRLYGDGSHCIIAMDNAAVLAVALYNVILTDVQMAAVSAAMAAL